MSTVSNILGYRSNLVQRGRISHQTITGHTAIGWLHSYNTTEGCWLTNGAASIGAQSPYSSTSSNGSSTTTRGTTRNALSIPWITGLLEGRIFSGTTHGKLIHVGLANYNRILSLQLGHNSCIIRSNEILQNLGCTGSLYTLGADVILNGARDTLQEGNGLPLGNLIIYGLCLSNSLVTGNGQICLNITLHLINTGQNCFSKLQ